MPQGLGIRTVHVKAFLPLGRQIENGKDKQPFGRLTSQEILQGLLQNLSIVMTMIEPPTAAALSPLLSAPTQEEAP